MLTVHGMIASVGWRGENCDRVWGPSPDERNTWRSRALPAGTDVFVPPATSVNYRPSLFANDLCMSYSTSQGRSCLMRSPMRDNTGQMPNHFLSVGIPVHS